jgi:hypothetical protein
MKSIINSRQVRKLICETTNKSLLECERQHKAHGQNYIGVGGKVYEPTKEMKEFANLQPTSVKLVFEFRWDNCKFEDGSSSKMFAQSVIDLKDIK